MKINVVYELNNRLNGQGASIRIQCDNEFIINYPDLFSPSQLDLPSAKNSIRLESGPVPSS